MSASNTLPLTIVMGALPPNIRSTPQQLADMIAARLSIVTSQSFALFVSGSTEPSSNVGPWLKNGTEWWVWSNSLGAYEPITINQASLGYFIGNTAPDHTIYQFWISTTPSGQPLAVNTWYSGAWTDVYAAVIGDYMTTAAFNAAIANYYTIAGTNAAIASAVSGITSFPGQAVIDSVPQVIPVDATPHKVLFQSIQINPSPAPFDLTTSRYVAPSTGIYSLGVISQIDNNTGAMATMQAAIAVYKNGTLTGIRGVDETPSPSGMRWFPKFGGMLISLATNDYLELWISMDDGVNTGNANLTEIIFSVSRISA